MAIIHGIHISGDRTTPFERAAPFLITVAVLVVSILLVREIIARIEEAYQRDDTREELELIPAHLSPETYALTLTWALDAAQLPALVAVPITAMLALRHSYTWVFVLCYGATITMLLVAVWFLRYVNIFQYTFRGVRLLGYGVTPIAIGGVFLNLLAAFAAAFLAS